MKIVTVVGARPQFIKASALSRKLRENHVEVLVHTGQHYDNDMSDIFFDELDIPRPEYNLNVGSSSHGKQTGEMLIKLEEIVIKEKPDCVLVYGDTNSTIAGALVASKLNIPVIHVEAGLRSFNMKMPEEQNRILTDHISSILFCPTKTAVENLLREGFKEDCICNVGDIMYETSINGFKLAENKFGQNYNYKSKSYYLATLHRAENTSYESIKEVLEAFNLLNNKVVFPVHPRISNIITEIRIKSPYLDTNIDFIEPQGYLEMLYLIKNSIKVLTDSGGLQKEAYFLNIPCITLRKQTEWIETLEGNWNVLCNISKDEIIKNVNEIEIDLNKKEKNHFGDGNTSEKIITVLEDVFNI